MATSYRGDRKGMREMGKSAEMGRAMEQAAEAGKRWAETNAPRGDTGEYARSFQIRPTTARAGRDHEVRAAAALENTAPHARYVDRTHSILTRSVNIIEGQR